MGDDGVVWVIRVWCWTGKYFVDDGGVVASGCRWLQVDDGRSMNG